MWVCGGVRGQLVKAACGVLLCAALTLTGPPAQADDAGANGFTALSEAEARHLHRGMSRHDLGWHWTMRDHSLSLIIGASIAAPPADCADSAAARCATSIAYVISENMFVRAFSFRTKAAFGWKIERVEDYPYGSTPQSAHHEDRPLHTSVECALITLSEEVRGAGRDPATGMWPRRLHQICINGAGRVRQAEFGAEVLPMTDIDFVMARQTPLAYDDAFFAGFRHGRAQAVPNTTPWRIGVITSDLEFGECQYASTDAECQSFVVISITDGEKQFAFRGPRGFEWLFADLRTVVGEDSKPRCAYFTLTEELRSAEVAEKIQEENGRRFDKRKELQSIQGPLPSSLGEIRLKWPTRKRSVCASPEGFVEVR